MALSTSTSTVSGMLPGEYGRLVVEPVMRDAVALDPRVSTVISITGHTLHVPAVTSDASSAWVAELGTISPGDPTIAEKVVTPAKVAALVKVSRELANDSNPTAQTLVGNSIARSIQKSIDTAFFADQTTNAPDGLEHASFTPIDPGASFADLDPFAEAISDVETAGGTPAAFVTTPAVALALAQLKDQTDSIRPLLGVDPTNGLARTVFGVPLLVSPKVAAGTVWCFDPAGIVAAVREDLELVVDSSFYLDSDALAVRAVLRIGWAVVDAGRIAKIWHDDA